MARNNGDNNLTAQEKKQIITLRQKGFGIIRTGKVLDRNPSTIYKYLCKLGMNTEDFRRMKETWSDISYGVAGKIRGLTDFTASNTTKEDILSMSGKAKGEFIYKTSLATSIILDQAPKVQINQQFNFIQSNKKIEELDRQEKDLRAQITKLSGGEVEELGTKEPENIGKNGNDIVHNQATTKLLDYKENN